MMETQNETGVVTESLQSTKVPSVEQFLLQEAREGDFSSVVSFVNSATRREMVLHQRYMLPIRLVERYQS